MPPPPAWATPGVRLLAYAARVRAHLVLRSGAGMTLLYVAYFRSDY